MILNNEKKIMLTQKALYAAQLEYYADLCETYQQLAATQPQYISASALQARYEDVLEKASNGELPEKNSNKNSNVTFASIYREPKFSDQELRLIEKYAEQSKHLKQFQKASEILSDSITYYEDNSISIDKSVVKEFHNYMQSTSDDTKDVDDFISVHTPTYIGHAFYKCSRNAIRKIQSIDENHIEKILVNKTLKPSAFGAKITGYKTRLQILDEAKRINTREEVAEYKQKPNLAKEAIYASAVTTGKNGKESLQKFYTKNRKKIRAVFLTSLVTAGVIAGVNHAKDVHTYNNLNIHTAAEQGYETNISQKTYSKILSLRNAIEAVKTSPTTPEYEDLSQIRSDLDELMDTVMSDLVTESFEEKHPEYSVTDVETAYDRTMGGSSNSEPPKQNTITITYLDEQGQEQVIRVRDFTATTLMSSTIDQSFNDEYTLDHSYPSSTANPNQSFVQNNQEIMKLLETYSGILDNIEHLAATDFEFNDGWILSEPSIHSGIPNRNDSDDRDDR